MRVVSAPPTGGYSLKNFSVGILPCTHLIVVKLIDLIDIVRLYINDNYQKLNMNHRNTREIFLFKTDYNKFRQMFVDKLFRSTILLNQHCCWGNRIDNVKMFRKKKNINNCISNFTHTPSLQILWILSNLSLFKEAILLWRVMLFCGHLCFVIFHYFISDRTRNYSD